MMHAVLVAQHFTPTLNAGTIRWDWLSSELESLGIDITVVGAQPKPFPARQPAHERPTPPPGPRLSLFRRAVTELRRSARPVLQCLLVPRCDVIIATVPPIPTLIPAVIAAAVRRKPLVIDLRDTWPELVDNWRQWGQHGRLKVDHRWSIRAGIVGLAMRIIGRVIRALERRADLVITTTDSYRAHLESLGFRRVRVIRNSSGQLWTVPEPSDDHAELRILYLGTVGRAQNLTDAVDALALIGADVPVSFRVVGSGVHAEALRKYAKDRGVEVELLNRVPRAEVREHYLWADTALVMLRDWDALAMAVPSKLYEAMAFQRHVTAALNGEGRRIVEESRCGDAVPAGDVEALADLWRTLARDRSRLRPQSRARSWLDEHTDRQDAARRLAQELRELVGDEVST